MLPDIRRHDTFMVDGTGIPASDPPSALETFESASEDLQKRFYSYLISTVLINVYNELKAFNPFITTEEFGGVKKGTSRT